MGVEFQMGLRVVGVDPFGVDTEGAGGEKGRFDCGTVIWAAGVQASPLAGMLADATGAETDRAGRIAVLPDLSLPGHPEVFAIGDMASVNNLPGVCEVAMQGGLHAANTIKRRLKGADSVPFKYRDLGSAAAIGRFKAIVSVKACGSAAFPVSSSGCSCTWPSSTASATASPRCGDGAAPWSGAARPERVFSVGHTGGDLSLPDEVKAKVMPKPFPVLEDQMGWADLVARIGTPTPRRRMTAAGATGGSDAGLIAGAPLSARPTTFAG